MVPMLLWCWAGLQPADLALLAEEPQPDTEAALGWANTTDLGLTLTDGNSETEGLKLHNLLRWNSQRASFRSKIDGLRSNTADDRFRQVDPGVTWEPGAEPPPEFSTTLIDPDTEPDVEKYFVEARYERAIAAKPILKPGTMSWHVGSSWDRNLDAGILRRFVLYSGLGHVWWDREDLKFRTIYGLSWTHREEETQDPEKDDQFPGIRYNWIYENRWGKVVVFHHEWTFNANLSNLSDFSSDMTSSIRVPMSKRLSLRVSLNWLYNSLPALEGIDVVAQVIVVDPDGIPGNGDEYFETVSTGGALVSIGTVQQRKEKLDTVFTTSLGYGF
jgi:hypothetical protein